MSKSKMSISEAAAAMGKVGGKSTSEKKLAAIRTNRKRYKLKDFADLSPSGKYLRLRKEREERERLLAETTGEDETKGRIE